MSAGGSKSTPVKGILKKNSRDKHFQEAEKHQQDGGIQWDEMNILMTEHPPDKDYGHMKIDDPKTPYHEMMPDEDEPLSTSTAPMLSPEDLALKVQAASKSSHDPWEQDDLSEEEQMSEETKEHKHQFTEWRKKHYNEFYAAKRARELMKQDEEELAELELAEAVQANTSETLMEEDNSMQGDGT